MCRAGKYLEPVVIHEARAIPEPRQTFVFHGLRFEVLRRQRNRIAALRITPMGAAAKGKVVAAALAPPRERQG